MSAPTFRRRTLAPDMIRYVLDCPHATTTADVTLGPGRPPTDTEMLAAMAPLHEYEERCGCGPLLARLRALETAN